MGQPVEVRVFSTAPRPLIRGPFLHFAPLADFVRQRPRQTFGLRLSKSGGSVQFRQAIWRTGKWSCHPNMFVFSRRAGLGRAGLAKLAHQAVSSGPSLVHAAWAAPPDDLHGAANCCIVLRNPGQSARRCFVCVRTARRCRLAQSSALEAAMDGRWAHSAGGRFNSPAVNDGTGHRSSGRNANPWRSEPDRDRDRRSLGRPRGAVRAFPRAPLRWRDPPMPSG